jgi:hypothetical protein
MLFGLMAFSTSAQATAGAKWLILNAKSELKEGSTLHAAVGLKNDGATLVLHSEILHIKTLFLCTELKTVNAKLLAEGSIGESAGNVKGSKVLFSGCTTDLNGAAAPECTPEDPTDGKGFIVTKPGHALIVLGTAGEDLVKIIPDAVAADPVFATIVLPAACPIGTSVPVVGTLNLKDCSTRNAKGECENKFLTHLAEHLVEEGPGSTLATISLTPEHVATLLGGALSFLETVGAEEHKGLLWAGDPA